MSEDKSDEQPPVTPTPPLIKVKTVESSKKKKKSKRNSLILIDGTSRKVRHVSKSVLHSGYLEKRSQTFGAIRRWTTKYFKLTHNR